MSNKQITVFDLSDEQIESCFHGSSNVDLVRDLLASHWDKEENIIDVEGFGEDFAQAIEGFIDADENDEPDEWQEAYDINQEWGESIAISINALLEELNKSPIL